MIKSNTLFYTPSHNIIVIMVVPYTLKNIYWQQIKILSLKYCIPLNPFIIINSEEGER